MRVVYYRGVFVSLLLLFSTQYCFAQKSDQQYVDSLIRLLPVIKDDTNRLYLLCNLSNSYCNINPDEGIAYGEQALVLAMHINWQLGIAQAYINLGENYEKTSAFPTALDYDLKGMKICEQLNDTPDICTNMENIGIVYERLGNTTKALLYDSMAFDIAKYMGDTAGMLICIQNEGAVYDRMKDHNKALDYYQTALKICTDRQDSTGMATALNNLGSVYLKLRDYSKSIKYTSNALEISKRLGDNVFTSMILGNLGGDYCSLVQDSTKKIHPDAFISASRAINLRKAYDYLSQSITIAKRLNEKAAIYSSLVSLTRVCKLTGNYKEALITYEQCMLYKDSVYSNDVRLKVAALETKRETELKDKEVQINKLALKEERNERILFGALLALLAVIILAVYRNYNTQKKAKEKQQVTNKLLEESLTQKDMLMKEIHHRVKNNLQVISTLLDLQLDNISDTTAIKAMTEGMSRIKSISLIHQQLYQNENVTSIEFSKFTKDLLHQVTSVFKKHGQQVLLINEIPETLLDIDTAVPLGLIVNELITNSYKYAFGKDKEGSINIKLENAGEYYKLTYADSGPGLPDGYDRNSGNTIGIMVIDSLSKQLGGNFTFDKVKKEFIVTFKDITERKKIA